MKKGSALHAFELMATAKAMTELYEANKEVTATYVHATARGHEAIQLAVALQLEPTDFMYPLLPRRRHAFGHWHESL